MTPPNDMVFYRPHLHPPPPKHPQTQLPPPADSYGVHDLRSAPPADVVLLVGKRRRPYHVDPQILMRGSAYFNSILTRPSPASAWPPLAIDCEESVFENLVLLMQYGTLQALPAMSAGEMYQLKKEAIFFRIEYMESPGLGALPRQAVSGESSSSSGRSDGSGASSPRSPMSGSPKSPLPPTPPTRRASRRHEEGVRVACSTPQRGLSELPEFPLDLADPAKMVLMTCLDGEKERIYRCSCGGRSDGSTQWALNFHHRHAFCTACGEAPQQMSAKHFAEMFMSAAALYASEQRGAAAATQGRWRIGCDSTCLLRFVRSAGDGAEACACGAAGGDGAGSTVWAASSYYSHAFRTCCGETAKGPALLSVLLALRYGGATSKSSRSARWTSAAPNSARH